MTNTQADATRKDRPKITSRKVVVLSDSTASLEDSIARWAEQYLALAVRGVRSEEVAGKISRHLQRFEDWFLMAFGHDRLSSVTPREVAVWRNHLLATEVRVLTDGRKLMMAPATVNNHLAHLSAFFTWTAVHAPRRLLPHGDPTLRVDMCRLPAPEARALADAQVRTVKNVLDRLDSFHQLTGREHRGQQPRTHRHARPLRDRAIINLMLGTGLRRAEVTGLDLIQLEPSEVSELRRVKRARLAGVKGKGKTTRTVFLGLDARSAIADYLEKERPGDADDESPALFLSAASIASRRPGGRLSPRSINTIVVEVGSIHDLEVSGPERKIGNLRPHDLRHTFAYRLSAESGHNRAELERRLGHANDRYLRIYTNPPDDVAAGFIENF